MIKVDYVSDLHLDNNTNLKLIFNNHDYLIIAGDFYTFTYNCGNLIISYLEKILTEFSYKKIFFVLGNHDYYNMTLQGQLNYIRNELLKSKFKDNIVLLDYKNPYIGDDFSIFGDTLWSNIPSSSETAIASIGDFNYIKCAYGANLQIWEVNEWNKIALDSLKLFLDTDNKNKIVVSHFPPFMLDLGYGVNEYSCYFGNSNLEYFLDKFPSHWVYGHTHVTHSMKELDCNFWCNPIGYNTQSGTVHTFIIEEI